MSDSNLTAEDIWLLAIKEEYGYRFTVAEGSQTAWIYDLYQAKPAFPEAKNFTICRLKENRIFIVRKGTDLKDLDDGNTLPE